MKWLMFCPLIGLLTSCIFVEGTIINPPEDIIVSPKKYPFTPHCSCHAIDVTQAKEIVKKN